ncbi:hypothetical protein ARAM_003996 [Aspergillus rambellii]|uniref:5-formyltetrahydrofolate cyclo-ligase n=3 Tax=Aspergillus subgen. Nidulantes TaxID=2720870 RepID=A0A0F8WZ04_9EURO|nr:hypothetical protein ARAM_003996 [Aspergillus rambellii]
MDMLTLESMEEFTSLTPDKWGIPSLTKARALKKKNCFGRVGISGAESDEVSGDSSGLDMILMPGMAFDPQFRRLGHGKGYYDSFLAKYSKWDTQTQRTLAEMPLLVALSLKEQTLSPPEEIPVTSHDWPVDVLIVGDDQCFVRQR